MREYLLVLLVAAGTTYLLSGLCRSLAVRTGVLAKVRNRDVHTHPIPYFGGIAMLGGLAFAFLLALQMPFLGRYATVAHDASAVLWASLIITVVGVLDDKYDLNPLVKLSGDRALMGRYTNKPALQIVAWIVVALIVALNVALIVLTLGGFA